MEKNNFLHHRTLAGKYLMPIKVKSEKMDERNEIYIKT